MKRIYLSLVLALVYAFAIASPDIYTPELVSPANNQGGVAPNVELDWNPVVGLAGLYYVVHLSTDEAFTNPTEFATDLSRYRMAELMFGGEYYWKVRAVDPSGSSEWSETRKFTVVTRPILRRPNQGATVDCNVELQWDIINGVSHFDYQFDTTAAFNSPELLHFSASGAVNKANAANLLFGTKYYLRLRARHASDTSAWSDVRDVTTLNTFALRKPDQGATGITPDAELQWTEIKGINKYNIFISTDENFVHYETYNALKTATRIKPDTLNFGTQYFWQMAAIHSKDTLMSNVRNFTTVATVALAAPANNSTNVILQPILSWTKLTGVRSYALELARNSDFTGTGLYKYSINATTSAGAEQFKVPINVLDSAFVFYWRVRAISSRDTSDWSATWNFRTVTLGINDPGSVNSGLVIYPTPASNYINIKMNSNLNGQAEATLYDLLGKTRISRSVAVTSGQIKDFDLGDMPEGVYILRLQINGISAMSRVIIKK
jgi:hypothetical protein